MASIKEIDGVTKVQIVESRWSVEFNLTLADGTRQHFVASADSGLTDNSAIFFGTAEEYVEAVAAL